MPDPIPFFSPDCQLPHNELPTTNCPPPIPQLPNNQIPAPHHHFLDFPPFLYYYTGMTTYQLDSPEQQSWKPIKKPAEIVESRLIEAILDGTFPANSHLPAERELAVGAIKPHAARRELVEVR